MYLALFLAPWVLMYAVSTIVMNHREFFQAAYGGQPVAWETERELTYQISFPANMQAEAAGSQILASLGLDGFHQVRRANDTGIYTIQRYDLLSPRRITYDPGASRLKIERQVFRAPVLLERMHRRRGYQEGRGADNLWAFTVDLMIATLVFWAASGLWMWWELRSTRKWGALCASAGLGLFTLFLLMI